MAIRDQFMRLHLECMRTKWYGIIERFNHGYPLRTLRPSSRTLEIGAGIGSHLDYERLEGQDYHALELRPELCRILRKRFPTVNAVQATAKRGCPSRTAASTGSWPYMSWSTFRTFRPAWRSSGG
jgi:hypothetical protein